MTIEEIRKELQERPELVELVKAYQAAEKRNPRGVDQVRPLILKILTEGKQHGTMAQLRESL